jgi:hypothetical protein
MGVLGILIGLLGERSRFARHFVIAYGGTMWSLKVSRSDLEEITDIGECISSEERTFLEEILSS